MEEKIKVVETEKCVNANCGVDTGVPKDLHIDFRYGYIEGAGQLCKECAKKLGV